MCLRHELRNQESDDIYKANIRQAVTRVEETIGRALKSRRSRWFDEDWQVTVDSKNIANANKFDFLQKL